MSATSVHLGKVLLHSSGAPITDNRPMEGGEPIAKFDVTLGFAIGRVLVTNRDTDAKLSPLEGFRLGILADRVVAEMRSAEVSTELTNDEVTLVKSRLPGWPIPLWSAIMKEIDPAEYARLLGAPPKKETN